MKERRLTQRQYDTCEALRWGMEHFGALCTGWGTKTHDLRAAEAQGLAKCEGYNPICDDDGFLIQPETYRLTFTLTPYGELMLSREEELRWAELFGQGQGCTFVPYPKERFDGAGSQGCTFIPFTPR